MNGPVLNRSWLNRYKLIAATFLVSSLLTSLMAQAGTEEDLALYRSYFLAKFPGVKMEEFKNGVYAIDEVSRDSWEAIEEFPPYEPDIDQGEQQWNTPFINGKTYISCFADGPAIRNQYPYWDKNRAMVITLPVAINECREANGETPLQYKKGKIAKLLAYIGYASRDQKVNVVVPEDDSGAIEAYNKGKQFYFARRGQLNLSCAHCHAQQSGAHLRTDILSPALGHATGWPVYRSKWGELGTLHRRFLGCNKQVRAKPFQAQGEEYRNLEYFLTHMSNGISFNGPSARK